MLGDDNIIIVLSCVAHSLTFITTKWQNPKIKLKKKQFHYLSQCVWHFHDWPQFDLVFYQARAGLQGQIFIHLFILCLKNSARVTTFPFICFSLPARKLTQGFMPELTPLSFAARALHDLIKTNFCAKAYLILDNLAKILLILSPPQQSV